MDTRFWGPSGWRLLHLISFTYSPTDTECKEAISRTFTLLPYVLPCKFCRESLAKYMKEDPLDTTSRSAFSKWLWRIHNKVNDKLRDQGILYTSKKPYNPYPSYETVKKVYGERIAAGCLRTDFEGWDFLFSIAENHPYSMSSKNSLPVNGAPLAIGLSDDEKNQWNLLTPDERFPYYQQFWNSIGKALPFKEWKDVWSSCSADASFNTRRSSIQSLWKIRCCMETKLELLNRDEFSSLCKRLVEHRSGCGKKPKATTCRKTRRRRKYV